MRKIIPIALLLLAAQFGAAHAQTAPAPAARMDEVVVTASPLARTLFEQAQPVSTLSGDRLSRRLEPSLGETLNREPGVSSTQFGQGASRPVIRGLGEDRIRVLQNGVSTVDVSTLSPDHAVTIDPVSVETIEIVRGPATLLHGPNSIGGVVNTIDNRVPTEPLPPGSFGLPLRGKVDTRVGSVAEERSAAGLFEFGLRNVVVHLDGFARELEDYRIPGFARSARLRERDPLPLGEKEPRDVLPNSFTESDGGAIGASYVSEHGYAGVAFSGYNSTYGTIAEPDVTIGLTQRRFDVRGAFFSPARLIKSIRYNLGLTDYSHTEYEGRSVGTEFDQEGYDGRIELQHEKLGPFEGTIGVQSQKTDFSVIGAEAVLPPVESSVHSLFLFEEIALEPWRVQFGARYDHQQNETETAARFPRRLSREFDAFSGSLGVVFTPAEDYAIALTASGNQRPPTDVELFSNGPHVATNAFEIGDPELGLEKSLAIDLTARKKAGRVTGAASLFVYHFTDFIVAQATGLAAESEEPGEEGLPIFTYRATEAVFAGGELETTLHFLEPATPPHTLDLTFRADAVWAEDTQANRPLPRITPMRAGAELAYAWRERFRAEVEGRYVARQNRTAGFELPTDSHFLLNAGLSCTVPAGRIDLDLYLKATNLTDAEARMHTSFLKELAPLPGRGVIVGMKAAF